VRRRDGSPVWIADSGSGSAILRRVDLRGVLEGQKYDEAWLQDLLHRYPDVLPIAQIEPGMGRPVPLCRELPVLFGGGRSGALDNLFVTPEGVLVMIEAKLWRNPEARRTVIAQTMDYAAAIFRLSYQELQATVLRARASQGESGGSLFEVVSQFDQSVDEQDFIDAVARNLRRGRAVVGVVGDGIREDLLPLADLLQSHAGHRFTFALIELGVYETPQSGVRLVMPSVLAQTALIERGVVRIEEAADASRRIIVSAPAISSKGAAKERSFGIGEDEFYEALEARVPGASSVLKNFLAKADGLGVYADRQSGLNLKHASPSGNPLNLGTVDKSGFVDTNPSTWWDRTEIGRTYNDALASLIGGGVRELRPGTALRTAAGKMPKITDLLPEHEDAWLAAMEQYIRASFESSAQT
jgi:hypothetical protein